MATVGRPSNYTPELAASICERLVEGESLRAICRDEDMPAIATIYTWFPKHPEFLEQYARAKHDQADTLADEILEIADDGSRDYMEIDDGHGHKRTVPDHDHIQRSRLRVDTRKWIASKLKPKKYGDTLRLGGDENAAPLNVNVRFQKKSPP